MKIENYKLKNNHWEATMAIKVIVNYPQTEEGMQLLKERQAEALAKSLLRTLSPAQIDELLEKLTLSLTNKKPLDEKV